MRHFYFVEEGNIWGGGRGNNNQQRLMEDNLDSPSEVRILGESNNYLHLIVVGEQGNDKWQIFPSIR